MGLIGQYIVGELFGNEDPVGKYLLIKGLPVQIIGVLSERGTSPSGERLDDRIVIPTTTLMRKLQNETKYVSNLRIRFVDQENLYFHLEELRFFLRKRHGIPVEDPDDFTIISPREIIKFLVALTGSLVMFLGVTGIISLIVAGFVLANLFLLSVRERAHEIGIRRSTGAKKRDILLQFLFEAVFITTIGGLFGFLLARLSSRLLMSIAEVGAFHPAWGHIHLGPENALEAWDLLGKSAFLPVHWGTFSLAMHAWDAPAETLLALGPKRGVPLVMPQLGEPVEPSQVERATSWWRDVERQPRQPGAPVETEPAAIPKNLPWPVD